MNISRTGCKPWYVTVTATLAPNGNPATLTGVDFTLVPPGSGSPGAGAVWVPGGYVNGVASITIAGPEHTSPPAGALVVSSLGNDLWGRIVDNPDEDEHLVDMIRLI